MPPIELGPTRPIGPGDVRIAQQPGRQREPAVRAQGSAATVALSDVVEPGEAPVDTDRVATIRKAIESGDYPIIPTKIADAMIAAGLLLRSGK